MEYLITYGYTDHKHNLAIGRMKCGAYHNPPTLKDIEDIEKLIENQDPDKYHNVVALNIIPLSSDDELGDNDV